MTWLDFQTVNQPETAHPSSHPVCNLTSVNVWVEGDAQDEITMEHDGATFHVVGYDWV